VLADLAVHQPESFKEVAAQAKNALDSVDKEKVAA
jgi:ribosomal protein L20